MSFFFYTHFIKIYTMNRGDTYMTPEERKELQERTKEAIKNKGFYGTNGVWNSIITFSGDERLYRERVETIIVRKNKEIFVKKKPNGEYFLPGGSTEKNLSHKKQAINECKEEAHINVKNIEFTGITYKKIHEPPKWAKDEKMIQWQGTYTEVYTAEYDSSYKGNVAKEDEDPFIRSGRWYSIKECFKFFSKEHKDALKQYLTQQEENKEPVTESYITNYFGNRKLLKKISRNPEVDNSAIDKMISELKKSYSSFINKSSIKREMKKDDVGEIFHPILTFDFPDGNTISICLCFDKSSITDGAAVHSDSYGDLVIIYPCFFNQDKNGQVFTLLHEIGHIRLGHLDKRHMKKNIFGDDITNDHRIKVMNKGKAIYPEVNADFYAILNGASMYSILGSSIKNDRDEEYDYRFTNNELANRYTQVWDKYQRYKGRSAFESETFEYDAACMAIYEMTYQNDLDLSNDDKKRLYGLIYEYAIKKKVNSDKELPIAYSEYKETVSTAKNPIIRFSKEKELLKNEIFHEMMDLKDTLELNTIIMESSDTVSSKYLYLLESLSTKERNKIPLEKFGIPEERKYPLDTKKHVISAVRLFGHCEPKYQKELANNIFKAMDKYHISKDMIGKKSKLYRYL